MTKLVKPILFSTNFGVSETALKSAALIDPVLNCDTKLFIDPLLISSSQNKTIRTDGSRLLRVRFTNIIRLVAASERINDAAWKGAAKLLALEERPETCLGYGGSGTSGSSRPDEIRQKVLMTAKEVVNLGENDPGIISLMGLFEKGVGPDTISDLATNSILPVLCEITEAFCKKEGLPVKTFNGFFNRALVENPFRKNAPVILVPQDIVRHLPLAADWSDVSRVVQEIEEIRESFNRFVGNIAEATVADRKAALRKAALESLQNFRALLKALLELSDHYDPNKDVLNFYAFRKILSTNPEAFAGAIAPPTANNGPELKRIVTEIIAQFRDMVENKNLWEMMWDGLRPKRERAAQLLFFAVADVFCKANNIDISPEMNMGGGPVDFKFSSGYSKRVLVEVKLSKGQVEHGYKKQLEVYKKASSTENAVLLVVDAGGLGRKLTNIRRVKEYQLAKGEKASDIEVVDAKRRLSASRVK